MPGIRNAIYLAIFLHMARKIVRRALTPPPRVKSTGSPGKSNVQCSEDTLCHMVGVDVEELLMDCLQEEISREIYRESLDGIVQVNYIPVICSSISISQDDIDKGRVRRMFMEMEIRALEPGYTLVPPAEHQ